MNGKDAPPDRNPLCQAMIDALRDPIHVVDRDLRIIVFNAAFRQWCRALGLSASPVGQPLLEVFAFLPDRVRDEYRQVFETSQMLVTEEVNAVTGEQIITQTQKIPLSLDGQVGHVVTVVRDVTARRRAEAALRESEERLRAIFSSQREVTIGLYDWDGRVMEMWANVEMEKRYGATLDWIRGRLLREIHSPELAARRLAGVRSVFRTGKPVRQEFPARFPNGEFQFDSVLSPLLDASGRVAAVVGFTLDVTERRQTERALRESEEKYGQLFATVSDAITILDVETRAFLDVNEAGVQLYGYTREEFLKLSLADVAADAEVCEGIAEQTIGGTPARARLGYHKKKDGTVFPVEISTSTFLLGQRPVVCGVIRDVTERERAQAALRESEEKLRAVLSSLHETIIAVYERDGRITSVWTARELEERYGWPADIVQGKRVTEFMAPAQAARRLARIEQVFRTGRSCRDQYKWSLPKGEFWFHTTLSPMRDAQGEVVGAVAFVRDVTEGERVQAALRESEEKYRLLAENANDIVYSADTDGVLTYVSPQLAKYGYEPEEMISRRAAEIILPEDRARVKADYARTISTGEEFLTEFRICDKQGNCYWLEDRGKVRRDAAGIIVGLTGVLRDITGRKRAEKVIQDAHVRLVNAREQERRRLARELHDSVGQTMTAMHLRLEKLRAELTETLGESAAGSLHDLSAECSKLIREVREISHGLYPATLEEFGLPSALGGLPSICNLASVQADIRCPPDLAAARFRAEVEIALFRIAQEAVNNALCHGKPGRVAVELSCDESQLVLSVLDDGQGFCPEQVTGPGLGLTSMRERVKAVGGTLTITSRPGETRVEARVPISEPCP